MTEINFEISPTITNEQLNALFAASSADHSTTDFRPVLERSLLYVCAYSEQQLIGFIYLAWDGGIHAFVLNPTVHPEFRKRGIGTMLVKAAVDAARNHPIEWVHVDYEPHLHQFYEGCGFVPTQAGLINLKRT